MLKIEIEPYLLEPGDEQYYYIVVNDIVDDRSLCFDDSRGKLWSISLHSREVYSELLKYNFDEVRAQVREFNFRHIIKGYNFKLTFVAANRNFIEKKDSYLNTGTVQIEFELDAEEWKKPFNLKEFAQAVEESVESLRSDHIKCHREDDGFVTNGFGITWEFAQNDSLELCENKVLKSLEEILAIANELLMQRVDPHSLLSYFRFPEEIKTPCTQYLVYFAQFLEDLGIRAEVELTQADSGAVLFKVVPQDKESSLKAIRNALDAYLAASSTDFLSTSFSGGGDTAMMQLQSNVMHLQSQLMLARSSLQMKDATIEVLQLANFQYKQQLSDDGKDQSEDIIAGVVSVSKFESNGLSVNLAEILKRLKRTIGF